MKYIDKQNLSFRKKTNKAKKRNAFTRLKALLRNIDARLYAMQRMDLRNGNENYRKSKLFILLTSARNTILALFDLRKKKAKTNIDRKQKKAQIKSLFRQLRMTLALARAEMQKQKELEKILMLTQQKALYPERIMKERMQRTM